MSSHDSADPSAADPSAAAEADWSSSGADLLTVDELAAVTGTTVRTTRYYTSLGLLPPPQRRGRVAYYGPAHRARLDLVKALQDHGFTLAAIERYLARVPDDASADDLLVQRAVLTSWTPAGGEVLGRDELAERVGRPLDAQVLGRLLSVGAVARTEDGRFSVLPAFDVGVQLLEVDLPLDGVVEATEVIERHMSALADELTAILHRRLLAPYRAGQGGADGARLGSTVDRLRSLTLQAVVVAFQRAADSVIRRSLAERDGS